MRYPKLFIPLTPHSSPPLPSPPLSNRNSASVRGSTRTQPLGSSWYIVSLLSWHGWVNFAPSMDDGPATQPACWVLFGNFCCQTLKRVGFVLGPITAVETQAVPEDQWRSDSRVPPGATDNNANRLQHFEPPEEGKVGNGKETGRNSEQESVTRGKHR